MDATAHKWKYFDLQATWAIDVFGLIFDMLAMGVWTTSRWQTSGRIKGIKCLYFISS